MGKRHTTDSKAVDEIFAEARAKGRLPNGHNAIAQLMSGAMQIVRTATNLAPDPDRFFSNIQFGISKSTDYAASWITNWSQSVPDINGVPDNRKPLQILSEKLRDDVLYFAGIEIPVDMLPAVENYQGAIKDNHTGFALTPEQRQSIILVTPPDNHYQVKQIFERLSATGMVAPEKLGKTKNVRNFDINLDSAIREAKAFCRYIEKPETIPYSESRYLSNAKELDGKKEYYALGREMFARAFECYVYDKLHAAGMPCDYLVHSVDERVHADAAIYKGNPYPAGTERQEINTQMERMVIEIGEIVNEHILKRSPDDTGLHAKAFKK
jgi:hypothetical protein